MPTCPLCQEPKTTLLAEVQDLEFFTCDDFFQYYNCSSCDAIFIYPFPVERLGEIYPDQYYSFQDHKPSFLERVKNSLDRSLFKKITDPLPGKSIKVLDVGGGGGFILDNLKLACPRVKETTVVDLTTTAQATAEKKGHNFFLGKVENFPSEESFDLILMLNLIEHVHNPQEILVKALSLLSPGGRLLIKTPNTKTLDRYLFQNSYWGGYHCPRHWILFNMKNLTNLCNELQFNILESYYTQGAPQWGQSIIGWLQLKGVIKLGPDKTLDQTLLFPMFLAFFATFDFVRRVFSPTAQMIFLLEKPNK